MKTVVPESPFVMSHNEELSMNQTQVCQCCGKQDCVHLDYFDQIVKKLESDTRLAAEIGQGLLHKHELYVTESSQQRSLLERQLREHQERILLLEQSLEQVENEKSDISKEKNKWFWEYKKRQKMLDETVSDLELANDKCSQLSKEIDLKTKELEKLRLFKFMARQSESREEILTAKLQDTHQELVICKKNELLLESKIKKLSIKYENLCNSHEIMLQDFQDKLLNTASTTTHGHEPKHVSYSDTHDFIDLMKELSIANSKLKRELINCKDQLSESKVHIIALTQKIKDLNTKRLPSLSVKENKRLAIKSRTLPPLPTMSTSLPSSSESTSTQHLYFIKSQNETPSSCLLEAAAPFVMLQEQITHIIERLRGSDIRALNRRLKRAFDIYELSNMSNSIIDNILMDVDTLESRFLWVTHPDFFPLLHLFKDLLKELGLSRTTMNELQVEYVKKIQQNELRVEEEIQKKQVIIKPMMTRSPFHWILQFFCKTQSIKSDHGDTWSSMITGSSTTSASSHRSSPYSTPLTMESTHEEPISRHIRHVDTMRRRHIPYFPSMTTSNTHRSTTPSIPIRRHIPRMNIDYEGIGPATIRPILSDRDNIWKTLSFSSSWLGGK